MDGVVIQQSLHHRTGRVRYSQDWVSDNIQEELDSAYNHWINDSFWLNPFASFRDDGVEIALLDGGLFVEYHLGGRTPGDAYWWRLDQNGRPIAWKMWVSIVPIGGLELSWEGWVQLDSGAWISTVHRLGSYTLELTDVYSMSSKTLQESDPFYGLDVIASDLHP